MQNVVSYAPVEGQSQIINLLQQSGFTEVINDTNFLLIIQTNNGTCYQVPGVVQIYPTPVGGGTFAVQGVQVNYLATDPGIADFVTINQYLEDELVGTSYPYFIARAVQIADNTLGQQVQAATAANLTAGLSVSVGSSLPAGLPVQAYFHLTGVDFSVDQEATAHGWTLTITGLIGNTTLTYVGHTKTATDTQVNLRWNPGIVSSGQGSNINVTASIAAVSSSTARAALNMVGFLQ